MVTPSKSDRTVSNRPVAIRDINNLSIGDYSIFWKARFSKEGGSNVTITAYTRAGNLITDAKWMISQKTYDAAGDIIEVDYVDGIADFKNVYDNGDQAVISGATQANPGVLTVTTTAYTGGDADDIADDDIVEITAVVGMVELNTNFYIIDNWNAGAKTFTLKTLAGVAVDTSAFTAYTSGGLIHKRTYSNYTYS